MPWLEAGRFFSRTPYIVGAGVCLLLAFLSNPMEQVIANPEITYPSQSFSKLDTFEALNLEDADKLFAQKDYKGAFAAYKAYSSEYTRSAARPYVLLRMGRCLHYLDKRNAAIQAYQDVVDYFPDDVRYAAAALYYIGECHGQNGDEEKKVATWAKMVKDNDYVAQPQSGTALTYLGDAMAKLGKHEEAAEYQWRTAVNFAKTNPNAAKAAREAVIAHYVRRSPNHDKLKEFFIATNGFGSLHGETGNPDEDVRYWTGVFQSALDRNANAEVKEKPCGYWTAKMGDKFKDNDDLRKMWIDALYVHEKDRSAWQARLDKQFTQKKADLKRVYKWCDYYRHVDPKLSAAFYARHGQPLLAGLKTFDEKWGVMNQLRHLRLDEEAQAAMRSVSMGGLSDDELKKLGDFAAHYLTEDAVLSYYARIKDEADAAKARFDYYSARSHRNPPFIEKALAQIPVLNKSTKYASPDLTFRQSQLLQGLGRYEEAIKAYQSANKQPQSTWGITDCLVALKNYKKAITTASELEAVGGKTASQAALKVADIYKIAGDKGKEVGQLRAILRRYPKSGESSSAHNRLESYGVALVGGEAEAEE